MRFADALQTILGKKAKVKDYTAVFITEHSAKWNNWLIVTLADHESVGGKINYMNKVSFKLKFDAIINKGFDPVDFLIGGCSANLIDWQQPIEPKKQPQDTKLQKKEMELAGPKDLSNFEVANVKSVPKSFVRKYDNVFVYDTNEYRYAIFAGKTATAVTLRGRLNSVFQENKVDWSKATKYKVLRFPSATPEEVKAYLETKEGQEELVYNAYE